MKRALKALALAALLPAFVCMPVFADDDDDDDGYTPITDCGTVIYEPGHYKLINDLVDCDVPDTLFGRPIEYGVNIASDDVVLDLDGHTISCLPSGEGDFTSFGVFTEPFLARNQVRNGTVSGCFLGIQINQSDRTSVKGMTITGNYAGIEVLAGSNVEIKRNKVMGNVEGVIAASFFFFDYVGPGVGHRFHKNLLVDNLVDGEGSGLFAYGIEDAVISCNRADRNSVGIILATFGPAMSLRNKVVGNVANDNSYVGIGTLGEAFGDFVFSPIPADNIIKRNSAMNNPLGDLSETVLDYEDGLFKPNPDGSCPNTWKKNTYGTADAAEGCIGPPAYFDDDDDHGCAPGYDDEDD